MTPMIPRWVFPLAAGRHARLDRYDEEQATLAKERVVIHAKVDSAPRIAAPTELPALGAARLP